MPPFRDVLQLYGTAAAALGSHKTAEKRGVNYDQPSFSLKYDGASKLDDIDTADSEPFPTVDTSSAEEFSDVAQSSLGGLSYWENTASGIGLTYVRQRWLDNSTGQWLTVDPDPSEPRYSYAHNSPTMQVDPNGTQTAAQNIEARELRHLQQAREKIKNEKASASILETTKEFTRRAILAGTDKPYPFPAPGILPVEFEIGPFKSRDVWLVFTNLMSPIDRVTIAKALLGPMEVPLRDSARRNGIPMWLLANVVMTEMIDSSKWSDVLKRVLELSNVSLGPGQVQLGTAIKDNLIQPSASEIRSRDPLGYLAAETATYDRAVVRSLNENANSADATHQVFPPSAEDLRLLVPGILPELLRTARYGVEACAKEVSKQLRKIIDGAAIELHHYHAGSVQPHYPIVVGVLPKSVYEEMMSPLRSRSRGNDVTRPIPLLHPQNVSSGPLAQRKNFRFTRPFLRVCVSPLIDTDKLTKNLRVNPDVLVDGNLPNLNDAIGSIGYGHLIRVKSAICQIIHLLYNSPSAYDDHTATSWNDFVNGYHRGGGTMADNAGKVADTLCIYNLFQS